MRYVNSFPSVSSKSISLLVTIIRKTQEVNTEIFKTKKRAFIRFLHTHKSDKRQHKKMKKYHRPWGTGMWVVEIMAEMLLADMCNCIGIDTHAKNCYIFIYHTCSHMLCVCQMLFFHGFFLSKVFLSKNKLFLSISFCVLSGLCLLSLKYYFISSDISGS